VVFVYSGNREINDLTRIKGLNDTSKEFEYRNILNHSHSQHRILIAVRIKQTPTKKTCTTIYGTTIIETINMHMNMTRVNEVKNYEVLHFVFAQFHYYILSLMSK